MTAKGGFPELPDAEILAASDFLLSTLKVPIPQTGKPPPQVARRATEEAVPDAVLTGRVTDALKGIRGITALARGGKVTLSGMVDSNADLKRAEEAARAVPGVREIESKLISAELFEHD